MPRTSERGGPLTRARIAEVAAGLFVERGFDSVTVADVARAAGVSSVTVFKHFPRKEDLFLDRSVDAVELLQRAVRERPADADVLTSLRAATLGIVAARHPLSGLADGSAPFFRTVANSPVLLARAREIASELESVLAEALEGDERFHGDAVLLAAFFVAGYGTVLVSTARRLIAGEDPDAVAVESRERVERLFEALRHGAGPA